MGKYLRKFDTHSEYEEYINSQDKLLPNISYCEGLDELHYNPIPHDYSQDYFTFVALESGTFTFTPKNSNVISYSTNNGETWTEGNSVSVNNGDKVLWKGTMTPATYQGIGLFSSTAEFNAQGNAMSLLFGVNFKGQTSLTGKDWAFSSLFYNTKIVNAENLSLPATTLEESCYDSMFDSCTSLTTAPTLPATTLESGCYRSMFSGCTNLITAPELSATTLVDSCYYYMFSGCTSLNYIKALFTTTPNNSYTYNWVNGVAATGTFVKNMNAAWNVSGNNGVPSGWTVELDSFGGDDNGEIDAQ